MSSSEQGHRSSITDFLDALRRRDWRTLRLILLTLLFTGLPELVHYWNAQGVYRIPLACAFAAAVLGLILNAILSRNYRLEERSAVYTRTVRGLSPFGEDDADAFVKLGRGKDVSRITTALLDHNFRFGTLDSESGCGKTSLLYAGLLPELKRCGYSVLIDDINNKEDPLSLLTRLLRAGLVSSGDPAAVPNDSTPTIDNLLAAYDRVPRRVFVVLDQFEQFFIHYGRTDDAEPLYSFLVDWWCNHPNSQLRIVISIREDHYAKLAVIKDQLTSYADTNHNRFHLLKFEPKDAMEVLRAMASEDNTIFHEGAVLHACRSELASRQDGTISPVDLQILAVGIRDLPEADGYTADTLKALGGVEGALERYLTSQFENLRAEDGFAAMAILRHLSEARGGVIAGWIPIFQLIRALKPDHETTRVTKVLSWLSSPGVRLVQEREFDGAEHFRLVHDRLVAPVWRLSRQTYEDADGASLLLDQRVSEYLSNRRSSRFLLPWKEWWLISRFSTQIGWGSREGEKRELLRRSAQRFRVRVGIMIIFLVGIGCVWSIWEFQPDVLVWRTKRDLATDMKQVTDVPTLEGVATTLFSIGVKGADAQSTEEAFLAVGRMDRNNRSRVFAQMISIAPKADRALLSKLENGALDADRESHSRFHTDGTLANLAYALLAVGERDKDTQPVNEALTLVRRMTIDRLSRANRMAQVAEGLASICRQRGDHQCLNQAIKIGQEIDESEFRAEALREIARTVNATADRSLTVELLIQAEKAAETISTPANRVRTYCTLAKEFALVREIRRAIELAMRAEQVRAGMSLRERPSAEPPLAGALAAICLAQNDDLLCRKALSIFELANEQKRSAILDELVPSFAAGRQGRTYLRQIERLMGRFLDQEERAKVTERFVILLIQTGDEESIRMAWRIARDGNIVRQFPAIAGAFAAVGYLDDAISVLKTIDIPVNKSLASVSIAETTALNGLSADDSELVRKAVSFADSLNDEFYSRASALARIASAMSAKGAESKKLRMISDAQQIATRIDHPGIRAFTQRSIAIAWSRVEHKKEAINLLGQALLAAERVEEPQSKRIDLRLIAESFAGLDDIRVARRVAVQLPVSDRAFAFARILLALSEHSPVLPPA